MMPRLGDSLALRKEQLGYIAVTAVTGGFLIVTGDKLVASPAYLASMLVAFAAAVLALVNFRLALLLFTAFLFGYEEFNLASQEAFVEENITNTVLSVKLMGFALMDVMSLLLLLPVLLREWKYAVDHGELRTLPSDRILLPLVVVWLFGMMTGWLTKLSFSAYTWDLRMLGHVLMFYLIYSRTFSTRKDFTLAIAIGGGVFLVKQALFLWRYVGDAGIDMGGFKRVLLGSDLPLTALFLCMCVASWILFREQRDWKRPLSLALSAHFAVMLIAGLGKLTYLQAVYSLAMIYALHRNDVSTKSIAKLLGAATAAAVLVYAVMLPPAMRDTVSYALSSAFNWVDALKLYGDLSFGTRLLEIINVWAVLQREGAVLWGLGWGAPWTEIAVHMPFDGGAFAVEEQYSGIHVQTHIDAVTFMLKIGIIGTLIVYWSLLRFWWMAMRMYRGLASPVEKWTLMALMLMVVIFVPNFLYFIRLKYLLGFALAGVAIFLLPNETDTPRIAHPDDAE